MKRKFATDFQTWPSSGKWPCPMIKKSVGIWVLDWLYCIMLSSVSDKTPEPLSQFTSQPLGCTVSCYPLSLTKRLNLSPNLLHSLLAVLYHATLCLWQNAWTSLSIYFTASWLYCIMLSSVSDKTPEPLSQFTSQPLGCTVSCYPLSLTKRLNLSLNLLHSLLAVLYHAILCLWQNAWTSLPIYRLHSLLAVLYHAILCLWQNAWTSLPIYFTASWLYCIMLPSVSDKTPEPLSQFTSQPLGCTVSCYPLSLTKRLNLSPNLLHSLWAVLYHLLHSLPSVSDKTPEPLSQFTSQPLGCTVSCYPLSLTKRLNISPNLLHSLLAVLYHAILCLWQNAWTSLSIYFTASWLYCIMLPSVSDKTPEPLSQFTSQPLGCTVSCYPLSLTKRLNLSLNLLHSLLAVLYHATLCLWQNAWTSLSIYFTASWLYCIMLPSVSDKTPEPLSQFTSQPLGCTVSCYPLSLTKRLNLSPNLLHSLLAVLYHAILCLWQNAWTSLLIYFTSSWLYCIMLSSVSDKTPEPLS